MLDIHGYKRSQSRKSEPVNYVQHYNIEHGMIQGYAYPYDIREQTAQLGVSKWLTERVDFVVRVSEHKVKIKSRKTVELFTWMVEIMRWFQQNLNSFPYTWN